MPCPGTPRGHAQLVVVAAHGREVVFLPVEIPESSWNLFRRVVTSSFGGDTSLWSAKNGNSGKKCGCRWRLRRKRPLFHTHTQTAAPRPPEILANKEGSLRTTSSKNPPSILFQTKFSLVQKCLFSLPLSVCTGVRERAHLHTGEPFLLPLLPPFQLKVFGLLLPSSD